MRTKLFTALFALIVLITAPLAFGSGEASWTGWITDSGCGAKGASATHADCARRCVEGGAKLVLYVTETQKIYALSDQKDALENLGYEVVVTGTLDADAITVSKIAKAEG